MNQQEREKLALIPKALSKEELEEFSKVYDSAYSQGFADALRRVKDLFGGKEGVAFYKDSGEWKTLLEAMSRLEQDVKNN